MLSRESNYHFMRPSTDELARTFAHMERDGFEAGMDGLFREVTPADAKNFKTYMLEEARAAWRILLPSLAGKKILDCGSGWGNLSVGMARSAERVVGLDLSLQRVRFAARRAAHERLDNLAFVAGGDGQRLPFADGTFDIAILNGVLEWIPTSAEWEGDPRAVQVRFLRELARVTKPDGILCVAIENRFGLKYWMRSRDEHTQIRYITLLPRWLASSVSKLRRNKPYREYTHSLWEYHQIAKEGGFPHSTTWIPHPDYRGYDTLVPTQAPLPLAHATRSRRRIVRWMGKVVSRVPQLANAYIVIAGKQPQQTDEASWRKLATVDGKYTVDPERAISVLGTGSVVIFAHETQTSAQVVVKLPLTPQALESCQSTVDALALFLADSNTPSWFRNLLPKPVGTHSHGRDQVFIQQRLKGSNGMELAGLHRNHIPYTDKATALVQRWNVETAKPGTMTADLHASVIAPLAARGLRFITLFDSSRAEKIKQNLETAVGGMTIPMVQFHGDFWLKNIIFDDVTGEVTGIIDWDRATLRGLPLLDLLHLLHMSQRLRQNPGFHAVISAMAESLEIGPLAAYRAALGLSLQDSKALLVVYVLFRLADEIIVAKEEDAALVEKLIGTATPSQKL